MSIYLTPVTFENQHIAPSDDGSAWAACTTDGISSGCALTRSGSSLSIAVGKFIAAGRTARVDEAKTFTLSGSGYDRLVLTIDMSKQNISQRVALDLENSATLAGFPTLVQNDINNGGTKYQFVICVIDIVGAGILWQCGRAHSRGYGQQVILTSAGWSNNQQTVYCNGVTDDANVIVSAAPANQAAWEAAGVYAYSQNGGAITFKCETVPSGDLTANILLY
jgi:hypothetical protein